MSHINQRQDLYGDSSRQLNIVFKYCFEVDRVPRREDACTIDIKPLTLSEDGLAIFTRDCILTALENDNINTFNILALKFYDEKFRSWTEVPNEIQIQTCNNQRTQSQAPQIVELLIREGSQRDSQRNSIHALIQNPPSQIQQAIGVNPGTGVGANLPNNIIMYPIRENRAGSYSFREQQSSKIDDLEREVLTLKERINAIEQKLETQQYFQNGFDFIHSKEFSYQNLEVCKVPDVSKDQSLVALDAQLSLGLRQKSKHEYICHQCHSEIVKDNKQLDSNKSRHNHHSSNDSIYSKSQENKNKQRSHQHMEKQDSHRQSSNNHNDKMGRQESSNISMGYGDEDESDSQNSISMSRQVSDFYGDSHSFNNELGQSPNHPKQSHKVSRKKKLDLVYLYSDPLVERIKDQTYSLSTPLDTGSEYREIVKTLQSSKKQFIIKRDAVNFEILKQILAAQPSMIHISCHGDYDIKLKQYYLAFEEKDSGVLDKLTEDRLCSLLGDGSNHQVQLVFVSACHSEMIGKIFLRAKIPVVVAVNSHTMILDEVCSLFSRHFYFFLQDGETPRKAFVEAQKVVRGSPIDKFSCCCAHDHKYDCPWEKYAKKHGYEKAHQIHMPSCACPYNKNIHKSKCEFYEDFLTELSPFEDLLTMSADNLNLQGYSDHVQVCCCQPDIPHDESIKFIINGNEDALDRPLFRNKKDGELIIDQDVNQNNKLQHVIDTQLLVGRNKELQKIVSYLFSEQQSCRLVHVYGSEGLGKSAIANYAAKYTLDRRKFCDGVYFIEIQNRNSGQGLISKICQKLLISNCNKEQLCDIIKSSHILIIIDKCHKILEQAKENFNKTLKYLVKNTMHAKFVVISHLKEDINEKYIFKVQLEITGLSKINAAKLLLMAAGNSKYLRDFKTPEQLSKHKIFSLISYKPVGILQMAPLLFEKSLDQIVKEKEEQKSVAVVVNSQEDHSKQNLEFGEFSWIMNISYRDLESKYHTEIKLLYSMCQFPAGLFLSDIEIICEAQQFGNWRKFLEVLSEDEKSIMDHQNEKVKQLQRSKRHFRMMISNNNEELQESHYIAQPIVSEYINQLVLNQKSQTMYFQENFKYLAKLSRKLLRSIKCQKKYDIDLQCVSSEIDLGIWKDNYTNYPLTEQELEQNMIYKPDIKFNFYEPNFMGYLDIEVLKIHFQKIDYKSPYSQYIDELCNNIPSIMIMLDRLEEAKLSLQKTREIINYFDLKFIKAKSLMIQSSILLKQNCTYSDVHLILDQAQTIFLDLGFKDGIADAIFLKGVALINSINQKIHPNEDGIDHHGHSHNNSIHHNFERSHSYDLKFDSKNPKIHHISKPQTAAQHSFAINKAKQTIDQEIQGVLSHFQNARKFYQQAHHEYGYAKVNLIEAEFQIDKSYGSGLAIEYNPKKLTIILLEALQIFKKFRYENLQARSLRNLGLLKFRLGEYFEAKMHIEDALNLSKKIQDNHQEALCSDLLNQILDKISIHSNNVFIFAKAFPLVEVLSKETVRVVGTFTRYPQDFRKRILTEVKKINKVVNLKFDVLSRELLEYVKTYGCRVFHVSSDVYHPDYLCIEGKNAQIEYISIKEMKNLLKPANSRLNIDLVVLAIPESEKLAQAFVEMGVPHVVFFDFKQKLLSTFMYNIYTLPKRYEYIYDFCVEFYKHILQEKSINQSWQKAKPRLNESIRKYQSHFSHVQLSQEDVGDGPILYPRDNKHIEKLFDSGSLDDKMQIKSGVFLDTSKIRGPTNIMVNKPSTPYTGRQLDTFKIISNLKKPRVKIINVVGLDGIGKTRFVQETAYYLSTRYEFQDGIFLLDLRRVKTAEQIKQKLKELNIGGIQNQELNSELQKKNILLIFDNIDTILKQNKTQFDWFLISLVQSSEHLKVIITSKKDIKPKDYQCLEKSIVFHKMKPLNDIEAVDMILSNCQREITLEELQMSQDTRHSIHHQLQQESSVKKCYGFPKYLEFFSNYLNTHSFDKIDIKNYIPNSKKGQMKRLHKAYDAPSDLKDHKKKGKAGQSKVYSDYKDGTLISANKNKQYPDTILEEEEEKELGDSNNQYDSYKRQRKQSNDLEEEKVPQKFSDSKSNDHEFLSMQQRLFNNQLERDDEFFSNSRRGSNMTKKLNSSSGGDDIDHGGAPCFATGFETKQILHKPKAFGKLKHLTNQPHTSLFASEDVQHAKRKESNYQNEDADVGRQDSMNLGMNQEMIMQLWGRQSFQGPSNFETDTLVFGQGNIRLHIPALENQISESNHNYDAYSENRSRSNSDVYQQDFRPSFHKNTERITSNNLIRDTISANLSPGQSLGLQTQVDQWEKRLDNNLAHSLIEEEEEDKTESKGNTDKEILGSGQNNKQSSNFSKLMMDDQFKQFGKDLAHSSYDDEEDEDAVNDFSQDYDFDPTQGLDFTQQPNSLVKQASMFTNSSGGKKSDNSSGSLSSLNLTRRTKSKKEFEILKEKQQARVQFGSKTGRAAKNFQKKTKNKLNEIKEQNQLQKRKNKKTQDLDIRQGQQVKHQESGQYDQDISGLIEEKSLEDDSSNTNNSNQIQKKLPKKIKKKQDSLN
eukprot:403332474